MFSFFKNKKNKKTYKRNGKEVSVTTVVADKPTPWEELGLTKEQYDAALTGIYGMDDTDFARYINRPTGPKLTTNYDNSDSIYTLTEQTDTYIETDYNNTSTHTYNNFDNSSVSTFNQAELDQHLKRLNEMVGLKEVKEFIAEIVEDVKIRKERENFGQTIPNQSLNMIFTGNPGTGKTTVAELVGKIMKSLGVLEKGHFTSVTRADLVEGHVGGTAEKTKRVLDNALGGILFIDEAYSLARGNENDFGKEAIDMIVEYMEKHKGNIVIILAGYTKEMADLFKTNTGLKSRFPYNVEFQDYTAEEMVTLARVLAKQYQVKWNTQTEKAMLELFNRKQIRGRTDSGNGRLVRNELEAAIRKQSKRLSDKADKVKQDYFVLLPSDFVDEYDMQRVFDLEKELSAIVGNEPLKQHIRGLSSTIKIQKMRKEKGLSTDTTQSLHMIFKGSAGTGKTTVARIIAKLFKELGIVKRGHLVEVTRSDLVGGYVGQTAMKTKEKVQEALGGVLFIDEAYSLARGGSNDFGKEAVDELIKMMEDHKDEFVVILAGYDREMDDFLQINSGLKSRFPYQLQFNDYNAEEFKQLFVSMSKQKGYALSTDGLMAVKRISELAVARNSKDDGNGRLVRNLLEQAIQHHSSRMLSLQHEPTVKELQELTLQDFLKVGQSLMS